MSSLPPSLAPFVLDAALLTMDKDKLAHGSTGVVFKGTYRGQPVCVKVLPRFTTRLCPFAACVTVFPPCP